MLQKGVPKKPAGARHVIFTRNGYRGRIQKAARKPETPKNSPEKEAGPSTSLCSEQSIAVRDEP
jgi:hypothetical protein